MNIKRTILAVPARLASSRLPEKVVAKIGEKMMIQHVLDSCALVQDAFAVVLCTDSLYLKELAESWGYPVLMTSSSCQSGSERIASVVDALVEYAWSDDLDSPQSSYEQRLSSTAIVNVQGDQPFLNPDILVKMVRQLEESKFSGDVITPVYKLSNTHLHNPAIVKVLLSGVGQALYFSRSAIPHMRGVDPLEWCDHADYWGHVGIYGYRANILSLWKHLPFSNLEKLECLEQLRLVEAGVAIQTYMVEGAPLSIDTPEQLALARQIVANK